MAILAYRIIELLDGEKGLALIPYGLAQAVKWWILHYSIEDYFILKRTIA